MANTREQYLTAFNSCKDIFLKKMHDYGTAWRHLRPKSLTDQILIKAQRIKSIEEKGTQKINESVFDELTGIINYGVMALIQLDLIQDPRIELPAHEVENRYHEKLQLALNLMENKNHDYGEAWRDMRISSITDLILMKVYRIKQIEDHQGQTLISEGIDANYLDIINYAIFSKIKTLNTL
ncbi:MAG: hypothetical protein RIR05_31 [Bacteroidota bacterium]|jgi:hypothetical protein|nr:DUF1599 domain-containing protein [Bacteroidia bacterium]NBY10136.1 DUF1599 domain-containing protein [Sphingobacteriia bacterium]